MIRVLSTMILIHVSKASMHDCKHVGKALIRKFPFLKEYVSLTLYPYSNCGLNLCMRDVRTVIGLQAKKEENS